MKRNWDIMEFRSLDSFGVAGQLLPHADVYSTTLFSTRHVGRTSDLFAAKLEKSANRELSLRCAILFPVFEACRSLKEEKGRALTQPLTIECGVDEEKIAIGIGFTMKKDVAPDIKQLLSKDPNTQWEGTSVFDDMVRKIRANADYLILKFEPAVRRIEIVAFIGAGEAQGTDLCSAKVIQFNPTSPAKPSPKPRSYVDLGDLDYQDLLGADGLAGGAEEDGEVIQRVAGTSFESGAVSLKGRARRSFKSKVKALISGNMEETRVEGASKDDESKTTVGGDLESVDSQSVGGHNQEQDSEIVLVKGSKNPLTAAQLELQSLENKTKSKKKKKSLAIRLRGAFRNLISGASTEEEESEEEEHSIKQQAPKVEYFDGSEEEKSKGLGRVIQPDLMESEEDQTEGAALTGSLAVEGEKAVVPIEGVATAAPAGEPEATAVNGAQEVGVAQATVPTELDTAIDSATESASDEASVPNEEKDGVKKDSTQEARAEMDATAAEKALEMEDLDKLLASARREAAQMKREVKSPKFASWMDGLVSRLSKEKTRLADASRKVALTARLQELEFNKKIIALKEEIKQKDFSVNQKSRTMMRLKEQLAKADLNDKTKSGSGSSQEEVLFKQKFQSTQTQLTASKEENALLVKKVEDLKRQLGTGTSTKMGASTNQYAMLHTRYERLFKQQEELKRTNRLLMEKVNDPRLNRPPAAQTVGADEYKRRLEASMQLVAMEKKEKEAFKTRFMATQQDQVKLRDEIRRLMNVNRQLAVAIQQRKREPGDSGGSVPPVGTPPKAAA